MKEMDAKIEIPHEIFLLRKDTMKLKKLQGNTIMLIWQEGKQTNMLSLEGYWS